MKSLKRNISKSCCDLEFDRTMPNVKITTLYTYTTICSSFKWIEPFFELSGTDAHTERQTDS